MSNSCSDGNNEFLFEEVLDLNVHGKQSLVFSSRGNHYEIFSEIPRSARKYVIFYQYITGKADITRI